MTMELRKLPLAGAFMGGRGGGSRRGNQVLLGDGYWGPGGMAWHWYR